MKLEHYKEAHVDRTTYRLTIDGGDLMRMRLTDFDRALLDDIEHGENVTIADRLLGLELLARRIEEGEREKT